MCMGRHVRQQRQLRLQHQLRRLTDAYSYAYTQPYTNRHSYDYSDGYSYRYCYYKCYCYFYRNALQRRLPLLLRHLTATPTDCHGQANTDCTA